MRWTIADQKTAVHPTCSWQAQNDPKQSLVNHFYHPTIHGLSVSMVCA